MFDGVEGIAIELIVAGRVLQIGLGDTSLIVNQNIKNRQPITSQEP